MSTKGNYQIPFDKHGNQLHYPEATEPFKAHEWRDNAPFKDTLIYDGFTRGRSAAYTSFRKKSDGKHVCVFLCDLDVMIPYLRNGEVQGTFVFTKRGKNYGCQLKSIREDTEMTELELAVNRMTDQLRRYEHLVKLAGHIEDASGKAIKFWQEDTAPYEWAVKVGTNMYHNDTLESAIKLAVLKETGILLN